MQKQEKDLKLITKIKWSVIDMLSIDEAMAMLKFDNKHIADLENDDLQQLAEWLEELKEYKALDEQGRLIKLLCKVGDIVYCIFSRYTKCTFSNEEFDEYSCQGCEHECDSKKENYVQDMRAYSLDWVVTNLKKFGKTVFLTKSEAEAKLKELRGNNE